MGRVELRNAVIPVMVVMDPISVKTMLFMARQSVAWMCQAGTILEKIESTITTSIQILCLIIMQENLPIHRIISSFPL